MSETGKRKRKQPIRYSPTPKKNDVKRTRRKRISESDEEIETKRNKKDSDVEVIETEHDSPMISVDNLKLIYNIPSVPIIKSPLVSTPVLTPSTSNSPSKPRPKFRSFNELSSAGDNKKSIFSSDTSISDAVALSSDINKRTNDSKKFRRIVSISYGVTSHKPDEPIFTKKDGDSKSADVKKSEDRGRITTSPESIVDDGNVSESKKSGDSEIVSVSRSESISSSTKIAEALLELSACPKISDGSLKIVSSLQSESIPSSESGDSKKVDRDTKLSDDTEKFIKIAPSDESKHAGASKLMEISEGSEKCTKIAPSDKSKNVVRSKPKTVSEKLTKIAPSDESKHVGASKSMEISEGSEKSTKLASSDESKNVICSKSMTDSEKCAKITPSDESKHVGGAKSIEISEESEKCIKIATSDEAKPVGASISMDISEDSGKTTKNAPSDESKNAMVSKSTTVSEKLRKFATSDESKSVVRSKSMAVSEKSIKLTSSDKSKHVSASKSMNISENTEKPTKITPSDESKNVVRSKSMTDSEKSTKFAPSDESEHVRTSKSMEICKDIEKSTKFAPSDESKNVVCSKSIPVSEKSIKLASSEESKNVVPSKSMEISEDSEKSTKLTSTKSSRESKRLSAASQKKSSTTSKLMEKISAVSDLNESSESAPALKSVDSFFGSKKGDESTKLKKSLESIKNIQFSGTKEVTKDSVDITDSEKITTILVDSKKPSTVSSDPKNLLIADSKKASTVSSSSQESPVVNINKLKASFMSTLSTIITDKPEIPKPPIKLENVSYEDESSNISIPSTFSNIDETSSESIIILDNESDESSNSTSVQKTTPETPIIEDDSETESSSIRRFSPKKKFRPAKMGKKTVEKCKVTHNVKTDDVNRIHITLATTQQEKDLSFTKELFSSRSIDTSKMTYRVMKRANFIIQMVRQEKVIVDLTKLMKLIREDEKGEGQKTSLDKKSLMRLIIKLSKDGYIKFRKATLKSDYKEKTVCFICHPDIEDDHSIIMSALDQAKMKFFIHTKGKCQNIIEEKDLPKDTNVATFEQPVPVVKKKKPKRFDYDSDETTKKPVKVSYKYDRNASKNYGYTPKILRTRIIHELLFYLIYDYSTHVPITERDRAEQFFRDHGVLDDIFETDRFSPIYNYEIGWRMFISPLPKHNGYPQGWTLICDVLLRLPVLIFTKCFNIPYIIPELESYLNHPIKKYFLVKNLPPDIRNGLMHGRRYIFNMHEIIVRLCHMGLLQFGPQKLKEKDQMFIYLNRKASLLDTVKSPPGYHQVADIPYETRSYQFDSEKDIEKYWYELWTICINTNLGLRNYLVGQYIVVEQPNSKPALMNSIQPKLPEEVHKWDNGEIPGDHRGAAGLDSALFVHLKRNWNWSDLLSYSAKQIADTKLDEEDDSKPIEPETIPDPIKKHKKPKKKSSLDDILKTNDEEPDEDKPKKIIDNLKLSSRVHKLRFRQINQRKRVIRQILPRKIQRNKKPLYDEKDKICITRMSKNRIDWTQVEDNVLMLCSVADRYLCPNRRRQTIEYTIMRDVLHKILPFSNDKTSRACQRRINYTMKNSRTRRSVHMCLEEIKQCEFVQAKFGAICKKYQGQLIPPVTLNIAFVELVQYMNVKFSNQLPNSKNKTKLEIPDNIGELRTKFDVSTHIKRVQKTFGDVENRNDIHMDVIRSVIHSSMACTKDKTSWSWQLFQIYQQYPENLLRSVISKVRHDQMMSVKKSFARAQSHGGGCIPLSSSPFQLSINYVHQLQNNKYHYEMYNEANTFLKDILNWLGEIGGENNQKEIVNADNGITMLILTVMQKLGLDFHFEHPDEVIILDPSIQDDKFYEDVIGRYMEIIKNPNDIPAWEESEETDFEIDPNPNPFVLKQRASTRIAFHMMRAQMSEGIDKNSAQHIHDYFVVNASRVFLKTPESYSGRFDLKSLQNDLKIDEITEMFRLNAIIPEKYTTITRRGVEDYFGYVTDSDLEYIEKVKCFIWSCGEIGSTVDQLRRVKPDTKNNVSLLNVMNLLIDFKIVFKVGVSILRFVHFDHKTAWIVKSDKIVRLEKEKLQSNPKSSSKWKGKNIISYGENSTGDQNKIRLLIAPWIRLDGTLNRRVLDRWIGSILSSCLEEPGISLSEITSRYDFLKPTEMIQIIELLTKLKCIKTITVHKPKVTLFSNDFDYDINEANILDDPKRILIDPEENAAYNFALFIGQKNYTINFFN